MIPADVCVQSQPRLSFSGHSRIDELISWILARKVPILSTSSGETSWNPKPNVAEPDLVALYILTFMGTLQVRTK